MSFAQLGLSQELLDAVTLQGYTTPTPIQKMAIPILLKGHDILAGAQTGTGKTAAFVLPLLQTLTLQGNPGKRPLALILTPTRELATQVRGSVQTYGKNTPLRSTTIIGGADFPRQKTELKKGIHIIVATPGRLIDHISQGTVDLAHIQFLVLDEADRMLDMGFIDDIRKIVLAIPEKRQTMLFSATYTDEIKKISNTFLENPESVDVTPQNTAAETVVQKIHPVSYKNKKKLLSRLIRREEWKQVLVFTRTKHSANRLAKKLLKDEIPTAAIHANKSQFARTKALENFKNGTIHVLVATDIAARGLDIDRLPHVVNYELPHIPEVYVHRIGRTGRAGSTGVALSLVCAEEKKLLTAIQKLLQFKIPVEEVPGFQMDSPRKTT